MWGRFALALRAVLGLGREAGEEVSVAVSTGSMPGYAPSPYYPQPPQQAGPTKDAAGTARTLAIVALVAAITGLIIFPLIGSIAAMVLGALSVGINPTSKNGMAWTAFGLGAFEWVLYVVAILVFVMIGFVSLPGLG